MIKKIFLIVILLSSYSCSGFDVGECKISKENISIFKGTDAWELAIAVKNQETTKIQRIVKKSPELLNFQESNYDITLLMWSVGMEKYASAEALLKCGADPNIIADTSKKYHASINALTKDDKNPSVISEQFFGETALFIAAGFSWIDTNANHDPRYVKLLLEYGANPNINYIGVDPITLPNGIGYHHGFEPRTSPLMQSLQCGIEKTKALVNGGADINHKTQSGRTATTMSLRHTETSTLEALIYAHYLIVEKKANVADPYYPIKRANMPIDNLENEFYPVEALRNWAYQIGSDEHKLKMEIVDEFARQGVNYHEAPINKSTLEGIKKMYPDSWMEYIKHY